MRSLLKEQDLGKDVFCPLLVQNSCNSTTKRILLSLDVIKGRRQSVFIIASYPKTRQNEHIDPLLISLPSNIYELLTNKIMGMTKENKLLLRGIHLHSLTTKIFLGLRNGIWFLVSNVILNRN